MYSQITVCIRHFKLALKWIRKNSFAIFKSGHESPALLARKLGVSRQLVSHWITSDTEFVTAFSASLGFRFFALFIFEERSSDLSERV
jgi:hypothetical protein